MSRPFHRMHWILFVSNRFSRVDRTGRSAVTSLLATLGICFGVMTLVTVMSVMNGFQLSFIDSILELSSYHVRVEQIDDALRNKIMEFCAKEKSVLSVTPFYETQAIMAGGRDSEDAAVIRAVDAGVYESDAGFRRELNLLAGRFSFGGPDEIVLGSQLARKLGARVGSTVGLLVMSGGSDVELFSEDRQFVVTGIFSSGYSEINSSYAFVSLESAEKYFGKNARLCLGIKIRNYNADARLLYQLKKEFPGCRVSSWREYNKAFFGALRVEKNILLLLVALIFVVVGINIYNGMRRLVFERKGEIAILSALGGTGREIKLIFILRGFLTGALGSVTGVILGLLISVNTEFVFMAVAKIMYAFDYVLTLVTAPASLPYLMENTTFTLYSRIPARIFFSETGMIALFGLISPLVASWAASKNILKMTLSEVLHDE